MDPLRVVHEMEDHVLAMLEEIVYDKITFSKPQAGH
jgi:hypothetical protein